MYEDWRLQYLIEKICTLHWKLSIFSPEAQGITQLRTKAVPTHKPTKYHPKLKPISNSTILHI